MSEPTLYRKEPCGHSPLQHEYGACPEYRLVPVEPDYKAGAEEIGRLVYVQLADIGYQTAARRIVKAVLWIGGDDE